MACPHAAGLTALLLAFDSALPIAEVEKFMHGGVETAPLTPAGRNCSGIPDTVYPNHVFGSGRINALQSLSNLINSRK
jgi:hypothetical protein